MHEDVYLLEAVKVLNIVNKTLLGVRISKDRGSALLHTKFVDIEKIVKSLLMALRGGKFKKNEKYLKLRIKERVPLLFSLSVLPNSEMNENFIEHIESFNADQQMTTPLPLSPVSLSEKVNSSTAVSPVKQYNWISSRLKSNKSWHQLDDQEHITKFVSSLRNIAEVYPKDFKESTSIISNSFVLLWKSGEYEVTPSTAMLVEIINNTIAKSVENSEVLVICFENTKLFEAAERCIEDDAHIFDNMECEFLVDRLILCT